MTLLLTIYFFFFSNDKVEAGPGYIVAGIALDAFIMAANALLNTMKP